jgi:hypothetical protein
VRVAIWNRCSIGRDGDGVALALRSPAALEDAIAGYRFLRSQGLEPKHIAVAGESAGGGPRDRNARIGARRGPGRGLHLVALTAHCTPAELRKSSVRMVGKAAMIAVPLAPTASIARHDDHRTDADPLRIWSSPRPASCSAARRRTGLARGWHRWMAVWPSFGTRI